MVAEALQVSRHELPKRKFSCLEDGVTAMHCQEFYVEHIFDTVEWKVDKVSVILRVFIRKSEFEKIIMKRIEMTKITFRRGRFLEHWPLNGHVSIESTLNNDLCMFNES